MLNQYYYYNIPAYYRADSSITEVVDVDIQKSGIVEAPWLVDTGAIIDDAFQKETNIYDNKIECNSFIEN